MVVFFDWKFIGKTQVRSLEAEHDPEVIKRKLEEHMNVKYKDQRKRDIAVDFHLFNYIFCKDQAFDDRSTSTFMSMMTEIFLKDTTTHDPAQSRTCSFQYFQQLLLIHSVERPPVSIQVFKEDDVKAIMKYTIDSYYRQFNLYKYIFSPRLRLIVKQVLPQEIEVPSLPIFSLSSGFQLSTAESITPEISQEIENKQT